jgi:hypothetical protein
MGTAADIFVCLLDWILFLFIQAIFINGIFISAKGKTTKRIDGTDDDSEMIFYPIYKFLHKTEKRRRYFAKEVLDTTTFPRDNGLVVIWDDFWQDGFHVRGWRVVGNGSTLPAENWIKEFYGGKMQYDQMNRRIAFYKEEDEYVFSKYLRKPLIGCIICMSSFWGGLTFCIVASIFFQWNIYTFLLLIADIISLSYVNFLIFKSRT